MTQKVYRSLAALLLVISFSLAGVHPALAAAPANDNFADAQPIPSLPFGTFVEITEATAEEGEPDYCDTPRQTIWYSFTPAEMAVVAASMQIDNPNSYAYLTVYRADGEGLSGLQLLACGSPDEPGIFVAEPGQTYYVQAQPAGNVPGTLQIDLNVYPAPENDTFASAISVAALPFTVDIDTTGAAYEAGEAMGSCAYTPAPWPFRTVWLKYTPAQDELLSVAAGSGTDHFLAIYQGTSLADLTELGCRIPYDTQFILSAAAGQTYYFQIGSVWGGYTSFFLQNPPPPYVYISSGSASPSRYDMLQFRSQPFDPANLGFQSFAWDFGDGTTSAEQNPTHQYAADGLYTVLHTATTVDGRIASATTIVEISTHDVAIKKIEVPKFAKSGKTREITVLVRNLEKSELVTVNLYRYTPETGLEEVDFLTQYVPVGAHATEFVFHYTFTPQDAAAGQITFKAIAFVTFRDARPADNELTSRPVRVRR